MLVEKMLFGSYFDESLQGKSYFHRLDGRVYHFIVVFRFERKTLSLSFCAFCYLSLYLLSPVSIYSLSRQWQDIPGKRQILRSTRDHSTSSWSLSYQTTAKKQFLKKEDWWKNISTNRSQQNIRKIQQHQTRGYRIEHIFSNDLVRVRKCVAKTGVIRAFLVQIVCLIY